MSPRPTQRCTVVLRRQSLKASSQRPLHRHAVHPSCIFERVHIKKRIKQKNIKNIFTHHLKNAKTYEHNQQQHIIQSKLAHQISRALAAQAPDLTRPAQQVSWPLDRLAVHPCCKIDRATIKIIKQRRTQLCSHENKTSKYKTIPNISKTVRKQTHQTHSKTKCYSKET